MNRKFEKAPDISKMTEEEIAKLRFTMPLKATLIRKCPLTEEEQKKYDRMCTISARKIGILADDEYFEGDKILKEKPKDNKKYDKRQY